VPPLLTDDADPLTSVLMALRSGKGSLPVFMTKQPALDGHELDSL